MGRLALVVGSECSALPTLDFPRERAAELHSTLTEMGGWDSATGHDGPLIDPTMAVLAETVSAAIAEAVTRGAVLLIAFVGRAVARDSDFFLLAEDSLAEPDPHTGFHVAQQLRAQLDRGSPDGMVVLLDACETPRSRVDGDEVRWLDSLDVSAGRMELLVATGALPADRGRLTSTVVATLRAGLPNAGEYLLPSDLRGKVTGLRHLSPTPCSDAGLWLAPNPARRVDAVSGQAAAGVVDQLTRGMTPGAGLLAALENVIAAPESRLRGVIGPPGAGTSTVLATFIRNTDVTAAVFLHMGSTLETFVTDLHSELLRRVPDFASTAHGDVEDHGLVERMLIRPLSQLTPQRVTVVVDGIDQVTAGHRELMSKAMSELTWHPDLPLLRLVISIRAGSGVEHDPVLRHMHRTQLAGPSAADVVEAAITQRSGSSRWAQWARELAARGPTAPQAGGWLPARLLAEIDLAVPSAATLRGIDLDSLVEQRIRAAVYTTGQGEAVTATLALLTAAGPGAVLPLELLRTALTFRGFRLDDARVRDVVVSLGALVARSNPGSPQESVGIANAALLPVMHAELEVLGGGVREAHRAITAAIEDSTSARASDYARGAGVRHYLAYGLSEAAERHLRGQVTRHRADNCALWAGWLPTFLTTIGADHPDTRAVRRHLAHWAGTPPPSPPPPPPPPTPEPPPPPRPSSPGAPQPSFPPGHQFRQ